VDISVSETQLSIDYNKNIFETLHAAKGEGVRNRSGNIASSDLKGWVAVII
jgi:hypothetical protein